MSGCASALPAQGLDTRRGAAVGLKRVGCIAGRRLLRHGALFVLFSGGWGEVANVCRLHAAGLGRRPAGCLTTMSNQHKQAEAGAVASGLAWGRG